MLDTAITVLGLILTIGGAIASFVKWRTDQLRREEVLKWVDDCITCLQTLVHVSSLDDDLLDISARKEQRLKIVMDSSILVERGRIFFKNEVSDNFGAEKLPAYRGYRPRILDHLVVAHQIARFWPDKDFDEILRRTAVAEDCLKQFVSLAQKEVGRDRAASADALKGGNGTNLDYLMRSVEDKRLTKVLQIHDQQITDRKTSLETKTREHQ